MKFGNRYSMRREIDKHVLQNIVRFVNAYSVIPMLGLAHANLCRIKINLADNLEE